MGLVSCSGLLSRVQLHLRSLFNFLDGARPAIALPPDGQGAPASARFKEGVELRDVYFHYPGGSQDVAVLQGVNAQLPAGKVTAPGWINGAGKRNLVKIPKRVYGPPSGPVPLR